MLAPVLTELIERLGIELSLRTESAIDPLGIVNPSPAAPPALARIFIDATRDDVALVYTVDSKWERVLLRRVPLERGLDEVAREELAHIVESAIEALAAGGQIGITRAEASAALGLEPAPNAAPTIAQSETSTKQAPPLTSIPQPAKLPDGPGPRSGPLELRVGLGWGFTLWTPELPLHGPELRVDLSAGRSRLSWGGVITAQYRLRRELRAEPVGVASEGLALRLLARARYRTEPRLGIVAEAGGGFDYERFEPISSGKGDVSLGAAGSRTSAILAARLGVEGRLWGHAWLNVVGGAELDIAPDDYVLLHAGQFVTVAEPLRVRPAFSASLLWPL